MSYMAKYKIEFYISQIIISQIINITKGYHQCYHQCYHQRLSSKVIIKGYQISLSLSDILSTN